MQSVPLKVIPSLHAPECRPAAGALTEVTVALIVFACIRTAQASSRAKGWLSVVSELTLRLSEGIPAAP